MKRLSLLALLAVTACDDGETEAGGPIELADGGAGGVGGKPDGVDLGAGGTAGEGGAGGAGGAGGEGAAGGAGGEGAAGGEGGGGCEGLPILGCGGDVDKIQIEVIGTDRDGLNVPRDLDFNPEKPGELWVVNRRDDSTSTFLNVGTPEQEVIHRVDPYAMHFMEEVSSIDFGQPGTFGTCQESDNRYNNQAPPNGFMGPALWPSDLDVYGFSNPEAVRANGFDLGSHLDMLHESPFCMGIVWDYDNAYWIFEGLSSSIMRADFKEDHGVGFDDHSDGVMVRYAEGQVRRVPDVPSHLELDRRSGLLYIADTGNKRIAVMDTAQANRTRRVGVIEPGTRLAIMDDSEVTTLGATQDALEAPSGIALHEGLLYVTDNATSEISAWTLGGELVDKIRLDIDTGGLMGLTFDEEGRIYVVDAQTDRLLRISPR